MEQVLSIPYAITNKIHIKFKWLSSSYAFSYDIGVHNSILPTFILLLKTLFAVSSFSLNKVCVVNGF